MTSFGDMMRQAGKDAQENGGDWSPPPGHHDAIVVEGHAFEAKTDGTAYAKTTLKWVKPGHPDDGREWDHLMGFKSKQQAAINRGQLALYGLSDEVLNNLDDVEDLAMAMSKLEGLCVQVTCKARNGGDGVWTSVVSSRTGKSDIPTDQQVMALGDPSPKPAGPYSSDPDDTPPW